MYEVCFLKCVVLYHEHLGLCAKTGQQLFMSSEHVPDSGGSGKTHTNVCEMRVWAFSWVFPGSIPVWESSPDASKLSSDTYTQRWHQIPLLKEFSPIRLLPPPLTVHTYSLQAPAKSAGLDIPVTPPIQKSSEVQIVSYTSD